MQKNFYSGIISFLAQAAFATGFLLLFGLVSIVLSFCDHDHHGASDTEHKLTLNQGQKWPSDQPTHNGMLHIESVLQKADPATMQQYQALAKQLQNEMGQIIKGCTMQGAAHENLHVFINQFNAAVTDLQNPNIAVARQALIRLRQLPGVYKKHFQYMEKPTSR